MNGGLLGILIAALVTVALGLSVSLLCWLYGQTRQVRVRLEKQVQLDLASALMPDVGAEKEPSEQKDATGAAKSTSSSEAASSEKGKDGATAITRPAQEAMSRVEGFLAQYRHQSSGHLWALLWVGVAAMVGALAFFAWQVGQWPERLPGTTLVQESLPGLGILIVGMVLFGLAWSETRAVAAFHKELESRVKQRELSELVAQIDDEKVRAAVRAHLALKQSDAKPEPLDITPYLSKLVLEQLKTQETVAVMRERLGETSQRMDQMDKDLDKLWEAVEVLRGRLPAPLPQKQEKDNKT